MTTPPAGLLSLLYSSAAAREFDEEDLASLLAQSRASNEAHGITGLLLYRGRRFIQVLEGPEEEVRPLVERISRDPRHLGMRVLIEETVSERQFAEWTMGYEPIAPLTEAPPEGFRDTFDDLEQHADESTTRRAARELSLWFRVRSRRTPVSGD